MLTCTQETRSRPVTGTLCLGLQVRTTMRLCGNQTRVSQGIGRMGRDGCDGVDVMGRWGHAVTCVAIRGRLLCEFAPPCLSSHGLHGVARSVSFTNVKAALHTCPPTSTRPPCAAVLGIQGKRGAALRTEGTAFACDRAGGKCALCALTRGAWCEEYHRCGITVGSALWCVRHDSVRLTQSLLRRCSVHACGSPVGILGSARIRGHHMC